MKLNCGYSGDFRDVIENAKMEFFAVNLENGKHDLGYQIGLQMGYTKEETDTLEKREQQVHPDDRDLYNVELNRLFNGSIDKIDLDIRVIAKDGTIFWVNHQSMIQIDKETNERFFVGILKNISYERELLKQLEDESIRDTLTDLYNRRFFERTLTQVDNENSLPLSVIIADINNLKICNDIHGHTVGDELIKTVSNIFRNSFRKDELIARWGGDEFVVLLPNTSLDETKVLLKRLQGNINETVFLNGKIGVAIGVATKEKEDQRFMDVFRLAERKMYSNKNRMKND